MITRKGRFKNAKAPFFFLVSATKTTRACTNENFDTHGSGTIYRFVTERIKIW
jgi:hypothetical protein